MKWYRAQEDGRIIEVICDVPPFFISNNQDSWSDTIPDALRKTEKLLEWVANEAGDALRKAEIHLEEFRLAAKFRKKQDG